MQKLQTQDSISKNNIKIHQFGDENKTIAAKIVNAFQYIF
jgi:hypothetical protein